jgi:tetratricopeptide (TPR) repeat protein
MGRRAEAIADLDGCVALSPGLAQAWLLRGLIKREADRRAEAAADFKRAIQLDPSLAEDLEAYLREVDGK